MAFRIGNQVISGELRNTRLNSVFGWLELEPDYGIRIELTGNFEGDLAGKHIRFRVRSRQEEADNQGAADRVDLEKLADRQIGVVGRMLMQKVKDPGIPIDDAAAKDRNKLQECLSEKDSLYLEWFSQNGRIVAELLDVIVDTVDEQNSTKGQLSGFEPLDEGDYGAGFTEIRIDEDGVAHTRSFDLQEDEDESEEDPYGLFDDDLENRMEESLGIEEQFSQLPANDDLDSSDGESEEDSSNGIKRTRRPWDEVIPGIDEETKALYEQWDEIFEGTKDEPIACLFETPLKLPKVQDVQTNEQAEPLVRSILQQLALLNVAFDMCEHFTALDTYRILMDEILPTAKVHPNLADSDMVLHFSSSDFCSRCTEEIDGSE